MNRIRKMLVAAAAVSCVGVAPAFGGAAAPSATINYVTATTAGFFISVNVTPTGVASCGTYTTSARRFVISPTSPWAASMIATALAAQARGGLVNLGGTGVCDVWPDTESLDFITSL